jgi:acetoacetyl-CoA synthetase
VTTEGELLTSPDSARVAAARITAFVAWLESERGLSFDDYHDLWRWSVDDLPAFWEALATWAQIPWRTPPEKILVARARPGREGVSAEGARFFVGASCNYADLVLAQNPASVALIARDEAGGRVELTYGELTELAGRIAAGLRANGVGVGDRVAAVLPNGHEAVAAFLATVSLGAIWSSCAPEFGATSMADRLCQIEPAVVVTTPSYRYGGREIDLSERLDALGERLLGARFATVAELARTDSPAPLDPVAVPFEHPLWILYSSGTTGLPKAIVQSHGGIILEHVKSLSLHCDLRAGDRFFWFSTTGWMMWNFLVGGLLVGATIVCYDGNPTYPDPLALFRVANEEQIGLFGTSAPFIEALMRLGVRPRDGLDCSSIKTIGSTGAPLGPDGFAWAAEAVAEGVQVASVSGGTDVCTAFLTGCPLLAVHAGELQCAALGARVEAFGPNGQPVLGELGELVITAPMPSMPVSFWNDDDGSRLHDAYFSDYPGIWRHGDFVKETERHSFVVYGRSDATLNRGGVRMGTAELYRVVEAVDGIADSVVVDTSALGQKGRLVLLIVTERPAEGDDRTTEELEEIIRQRLRKDVSPRHVPDLVLTVPSLPRTLNGKKLEVPLRRILLGTPTEQAVARDSLADPSALDAVLEAFAKANLISS